MPDIRYVCLSDLHFGAENSLLSRLVEGTVSVDTTAASPVLDALVDGLRTLLATNEDRSRKPTLVLNGDVLELALANDNVALMVFDMFLDRIFPLGGEALFEPTILYQPGNHDHHVWEVARERQYADLLSGPEFPVGTPLPIPWHSTRLYYRDDPRPVRADLLDRLAHRRPHRRDVNFRVSYPNMGILSENGETAIVFHHGHYAESIYSLMSTMKDLVLPGRVEPQEVWDIEAENFAWVDFFWSTLGRSGEVGEDVGLIYDLLQSPEAIDKVARNLAVGIADRTTTRHAAKLARKVLRPILQQALRRIVSKAAASERRTPSQALSDKTAEGVAAYLAGPLMRQVANEAPAKGPPLPTHVKFVFGHTHKPFVSVATDHRLNQEVRLFNTGGWVVDTTTPEPLHGANVVLVDEHFEVACVRVYNQSSNADSYRVRLDDGIPAEQGPFYRRLSELLRPEDDAWRTLSATIARAVVEREQALLTIIANAGTPRPSGLAPTAEGQPSERATKEESPDVAKREPPEPAKQAQ